ncbi:lipopolysaccharide biosynthesis protein [Ekhidna sp.]|uniref:lipopolysaccharide biosynthesis protein n=1 Tax=Ekhidna sp. TaxID=2608089 RepID=UPI003B5AA205
MRKLKNKLIKSWSSLFTKDSFIQNFAFVFGSKSITFLIGFALTPIIARVFEPEAYGSYALYHAIVLNVSLFLTMKIPTAFVIIRDEPEFKELLGHLVGYLIVGILLVSILLLLFGEFLFGDLSNQHLMNGWYLISLGIALYAFADILSNWNVREKKFKEISKYAPIEALTTKMSSFGIGWLKATSKLGLIQGELIGKFTYILIYSKKFLRGRYDWLFPKFSLKQWKILFRKYKEYPLYILPAQWISVLSNSIIIFFLSYEFFADDVGKYSMSIGLVSIPMNVIAYSLQPILTQKIASVDDPDMSIELINKFVTSILIIICLALPVGFFFSETTINLFLGPGWEESAVFISWMIPLIGFQIIYFPLIGALIGMRRNKTTLVANLIRLLFILLAILVLSLFQISFNQTISYIIAFLMASYFAGIVFSLHQARIGVKTIMIVVVYGLVSFIYLCLVESFKFE